MDISVHNDSGLDNSFIIEKLREGDRKIFTILFDYYYTGLVIYAERFTDDINLAEDTVQSAFVKLWENKETIKY